MKKHSIPCIAILLAFLPLFLFAQNGTIRGTITDGETGEVLMFANVSVKNSDPLIGTTTDLDGNYEISVPGGTYDLLISYVGFSDQTIEGVVVTDNEIVVVDYLMQAEAMDLGVEITVKAERIDRSENALLVLQRKAPGIQDGISAQEIARFGSSNAAESMKRVTGASVQEGKYILVRGLGDRYSAVQLNGLELPSTDPYRNSIQLDLIPSNVLDNLIIKKTFTPDLPGNFTGGNVNITTKSFPETFTMLVGINTGFNTRVTGNDKFVTYQGGDSDWIGYDDGARDVPEFLQSQEVMDRLNEGTIIEALFDDAVADTLDRAAKALSSQFAPTTEAPPINHGISFSIGDQYKLGNRPLGFLLGLNYKRNYNHFDSGVNNNWDLNNGAAALNPNRLLSETRSAENTTVGGLVGLSYKFTPSNKITFNGLYNHVGQKEARELEGEYPAILSGGIFQTRALSWRERYIQDYQLIGDHLIESNRIRIEWGVSHVSAGQDEPDLRQIANSYSENSQGERQYIIDPSEYSLPFHFFRELEDDQWNGKLDVSIPFLEDISTSNKIQFGGYYRKKDRTFGETQLQLTNFNGQDVPTLAATKGDVNEFIATYSGDLTEPDAAFNSIGLFPVSENDPSNSYTGTEEVLAGYGMGTFENEKFKLILGARLETTDITVQSLDTTKEVGRIDQLDILPSLNFTYKLSESMNIRASATQTLARPNMRELAPFTSFDFIGDFRITGNPDLNRTLIQNYDLRWEYFPNPGEIIAFSTYFKQFNDPIIKAFDPIAANRDEIQFQNVDKATVYGVELEFRKRFDFISEALYNLKLLSNFSYIYSVVDIPGSEEDENSEVGQILKWNPDKGTDRPFAGQSPFLVNLALNYADPDNGLDAILAFNIFGERLGVIAPSFRPDIYEKPVPQLDFSFKKTFNNTFGLKLSVQNILDPEIDRIVEYQGTEELISRYQKGTTISLGLSYNIQR